MIQPLICWILRDWPNSKDHESSLRTPIQNPLCSHWLCSRQCVNLWLRPVWDSVIDLLVKMGLFQPSALALICCWVTIKTAEPAAQTATRQSELWRWFDHTESAGCAKTRGLFSCHPSTVLPHRGSAAMVCCNFTTCTRHSALNPDVRSEAGDNYTVKYALDFIFHSTELKLHRTCHDCVSL